MDFFNKVGSTISSKSKDVTKKAKELAEISKLTGQIAMKEESIKGTYIELGKYVYENQKEDAPEEVAEKFAVIDAAVEEIDRLKREVRKLKGRQQCPDCGKEVSYTAAFCQYCGGNPPEDQNQSLRSLPRQKRSNRGRYRQPKHEVAETKKRIIRYYASV